MSHDTVSMVTIVMWFDVGKGGHFHRVVLDDNKMLIFAKSMMIMMMMMMIMIL